LSIGSSEFLNLISLCCGKKVGKLINLYYGARFTGHSGLGGGVLIQYQESRETYYYSEGDVERTVNYADGVVVRFAKL
jgi:hypothetical protein